MREEIVDRRTGLAVTPVCPYFRWSYDSRTILDIGTKWLLGALTWISYVDDQEAILLGLDRL